MQSKVSIRIIVKVRNFLNRCVKRCPKWYQKAIPQLGLGIIKSGSLKLSRIGRAIKKSDENIGTVENRLSRELQSHVWDEDKTVENYIKNHVQIHIKRDTLIYIDRVDYAKPHARKMEHFGKVWDGSKKNIVRGYWGFGSVAEIGEKELLPLINFPYYLGEDEYDKKNQPEKWGFKSENEAIEHGYDLLYSYFGSRGIWIEDRGSDDIKRFCYKIEKEINFITRLKITRSLLNAANINIGTVGSIIGKMELPHSIYYDIGDNINKKRLALGSMKVRLPGAKGEYTLVVIRDDEAMKQFSGKRKWQEGEKGLEENEWFIAVLTNLPVNNAFDEERRIRQYLKRWSIEDCFRFIKQEFGAESFLVRSFNAIRKLIILAYILIGILFLITLMGKSMFVYLEKISDSFAKEVKFYYYRILWGLRKVIADIRSP